MEKMKIAEEMFAHGEFNKATDQYRQLINDDPNNALAYQGIALCYYRLKDYNNAASASTKTIELNPKLAIPYTILAYVFYHSEKYEKSLLEAQKAYAISPNVAAVLDCYGTILLAGGKTMDAIPLLQKAVKEDPKLYSAHSNLAIAYRYVNDYKNHLTEIKRIYYLRPTFKNGLRLLSAYQHKYAILLSIIIVGFMILSVLLKINVFLVIPFITVLKGWWMSVQYVKSRSIKDAVIYFVAYSVFGLLLYLIYRNNVIPN